MNSEIKSRWVKALRSNEYRQGVHVLHTNKGSFCCLGVLCDLHSKETGQQWEEGQDPDCKQYGTNHTLLPRTVVEWAGVSNEFYDSGVSGLSLWAMGVKETDLPKGIRSQGETADYELVALNDNGVSFQDIADIIEKAEVIRPYIPEEEN